jgi:hypothetical protein
MWVHPNAVERNITTQFPEIFKKHEFLYFSLSGNRMSDFFESAQFLDASRATKDISKVFSAVQRAVQEGEYKGPQDFLAGREARAKLADANTPNAVKDVLTALFEDYNNKYGMSRQVRSFYRDNLDEPGKRVFLSKLCCPAHYRLEARKDLDGKLRVRIDFLLGWRNGVSHAATYIPLPDANHVPLQYEMYRGDPSSTWLIYLTFEDLYELTRKAMAQLWLREYETYWVSGGKETIERVVAEVKARCDELNMRTRSTGDNYEHQ